MTVTSTHPADVFEWLDRVRKRPGMYVDEKSKPVRLLEGLVHGYYTALWVHGIVEPVPAMNHHFSTWLRRRTGWSMSCGWGVAIEEHTPVGEALSTFFAFVDAYRRLVPTVLSSVTLNERHTPTGRRSKIGLDGLIDRPDVVEVVQYQPEPILFLRFHYGNIVRVQDTLYRSDGSDETTLADAQEWVADELQVARHEWKIL